MHCIFLKGLPGSGKSTTALNLAHKTGAVIFSRDDVRGEGIKESDVVQMEKDFMDQKLPHIIIDNTHMSQSSLNRKIEYAKSLGYTTSVFDMEQMFDCEQAYYETSHIRNASRDKRVPGSVIDYMFLQSRDLAGPVVIVDIDGTIADLTHRLHYITGENKDHSSFFAAVKDDKPMTGTIYVVKQLAQTHTIVLVSGRSDVSCDDTVEWLMKNGVEYNYLLMRHSWDRRPDYQVKRDIYNNCLMNNDIVLVMDDRPEVCELWKELDLNLLQLPRHG